MVAALGFDVRQRSQDFRSVFSNLFQDWLRDFAPRFQIRDVLLFLAHKNSNVGGGCYPHTLLKHFPLKLRDALALDSDRLAEAVNLKKEWANAVVTARPRRAFVMVFSSHIKPARSLPCLRCRPARCRGCG